MTPILCTDVQRHEGKPLYTVWIEDIDSPVNFHSYETIWFKQGCDLNELLEQGKQELERISKL